jgi:GTP-binding protein YchF
MKIGLIGLPNSGKTTIFNALTGSEAETGSFSGQKVEPHLAVVEVTDSRVTQLSGMYNPKKTIFATIELIDFAGMTSGNARDGAFSGSSLNLVKTSDALALVVRNFHDDILDETLGKPDPLGDVQNIENELVLSDLIIAETRLERIAADFQRGKKTPEAQKEQKVLTRVLEHLNNDQPLRSLDLSDEDGKTIAGFQFLSQKQLLVIINSEESSYGNNGDLLGSLSAGYNVIEFAGTFEMELSRLEEEEALLFMQDIGIEQSARERLTRFAYEMLGYISFFTVGEDECRAWTVTKGETALEAAGKIHSDLERGFIRAECFTFDDLISCGSEKGVKEKGLLRLEGKTYVVQDGDILHIRFSV